MSTLTLTVPLPPTTNSVYRANHKTGRHYMTPEGKRYKEQVGYMANVAGWDYPEGARLSVSLVLHFPHGKRRLDLDNRVKLLLDAVADACGFDDSVVDELHVKRGVSVTRDAAHAIITLEPMEVAA